MNIMAAMEDTMKLAEEKWPFAAPSASSVSMHMTLNHLRHMAMDMRRRKMSDTKKCRYLGWMQASIVSWDAGVNLETMKNINLAHRDDVPNDYKHDALYVYDATSQTFDAAAIASVSAWEHAARQSVVVCLNDFPDGVFDSQELADAYIAEQKALFEKEPRRNRFWHTHTFTTNRGAHQGDADSRKGVQS